MDKCGIHSVESFYSFHIFFHNFKIIQNYYKI